MRDLVRDAGGDEPAKKPATPPPPRERIFRLADALGARADSGVAAPVSALPALPAANAEAVFGAVQVVMAQLRDAVKTGEPLPTLELDAVVGQVILALEQGSDLFWLANEPPPPDAEYIAAHLASVGVLALRIAADLGYDRQRLADLGVAAFLFDVGLYQLPERLLAKAEPLTPDEQALYRTHPRLSAYALQRFNLDREGLIEAVLQHHEQEQGQGYPQGLPGSAIHPHAKIIGLADTYTRLTAPRPPRARLQPHEAIREIVRSKQHSFPSALIKALLSEVSVFPPRTMVKLNTGEVGRVVAVNRNHPLRPKVEVIADSKGDRLHTSKLIDLSEAPFLYITGPLAAGS